MGGARLLRRRLGAHPVAVAAITVSVLASLVVVTALQLLSARITDAGVRSALDVPPVDRSVVVTGSLRPGELDATDAAVRAALAPLAGATVTRVGTATSRGIAGRGSSDRAALADVEGLQQAAELTAGRWPRQPAASSSAPRRVEVVLPDAAATALAVAPGGSLDLTDLVDPQAPRVTAEVVGTFRPRDAEDGLWSDLPLALDGVTASDFTSYGPFVVAPGTFDGSLVGTSTVTWRAVPDLAGVRAAALPATGARADDVLTRLRTLTGLPTVEGVQASAGPATVPLRSPRVASDLPALVDGAAVVGDRVRVSLLTPAMLLVLLGSVALVGAAALLATLRDGETRLLRVRGASTLRLAGLALGDAVVVAVVGVLGAVLGAPVVTRAVSGSGAWWSAAVLRDATLWRALVPLALLAVAVTVATTLWVGRSREDARSRRAGLRLAAGSGLDVVLVVLGALAALQLRRYDAVGQRSVDLVTTIAPALVVAGLSVLALRLLPLLARVVARWGARRRGSTPPGAGGSSPGGRPRRAARSSSSCSPSRWARSLSGTRRRSTGPWPTSRRSTPARRCGSSSRSRARPRARPARSSTAPRAIRGASRRSGARPSTSAASRASPSSGWTPAPRPGCCSRGRTRSTPRGPR